MKHVGVDGFFAERDALLDQYDRAKKQTADDAVKTEHGKSAEVLARTWLRSFLPKRFGVCNGYIITSDLSFEGPLEEWDLIVYDRIESPVLFRRGPRLRTRAIPVEHVRAVIEVKATLNRVSASKCASKLKKIVQFLGVNRNACYPKFLCQPFVCAALFFEPRVTRFSEYRAALDELTELYGPQPAIPFMGALVLRSHRHRAHSGYLEARCADEPIRFANAMEMSSPFRFSTGKHGVFGALGWHQNYYSKFLFDFLAMIRGTYTNTKVSSFYGMDFEKCRGSRLFDSYEERDRPKRLGARKRVNER